MNSQPMVAGLAPGSAQRECGLNNPEGKIQGKLSPMLSTLRGS